MENAHSSTVQKYPNWLELPSDATLMILMKLQPSEILESAQFVCKPWYNLCKEPSLWKAIHIMNLDEDPWFKVNYDKMMLNAIDRSNGGLTDFSIEGAGSDELISYVASRSSQLKRLRLACCYNISAKAVIDALGKLTSLEELELTVCFFQQKDYIAIIKSCPSLETFKPNKLFSSKIPYWEGDVEALAIARRMPELLRLQLIGNSMTNLGLRAVGLMA